MATQPAMEFHSITTVAPTKTPADSDDPILVAIASAIGLVVIFPSALQTVWRLACPGAAAISTTYELFCSKFRGTVLFSHQDDHRFQLFLQAFRKTFGHAP